MIYEIKNEELTVTIESKGAELRSASDRKTGKEYLWNGDSAYWGRVSPVLFPLVGNYYEHESVYNGRTYTVGQHGFARDAEFTLLEQKETAIVFQLKSSEETKKLYPFDFILEIGYELSGRDVKVLWTVKNPEAGTIWFSIGAHPAFNCDMNTASLKFDTKEALTVTYLDTSTGCVGDRQETMETNQGILKLSESLFDDDALILENRQTSDITLLDAAGKEQVQVSFTSPLVGIWSPAGKHAPFVCIEPWYGRSDRNGFSKKLEDREYGNRLEAGEEFHADYTIRFCE